MLDGGVSRGWQHPHAGEFAGFLKPKARLFAELLKESLP